MADKHGEHWWRENLRMHKLTLLFLYNKLRARTKTRHPYETTNYCGGKSGNNNMEAWYGCEIQDHF